MSPPTQFALRSFSGLLIFRARKQLILQAKNVVRTHVLVPIGWSRFSRHPYLETPLNRCFMTPTWWKPEAVTQDSQRLRGRGRRRLNGLSLLFQTTPVSSKLASTTLRYGLFLPGHLSHVIVLENENLEIEFGSKAGQTVRSSSFDFVEVQKNKIFCFFCN